MCLAQALTRSVAKFAASAEIGKSPRDSGGLALRICRANRVLLVVAAAYVVPQSKVVDRVVVL